MSNQTLATAADRAQTTVTTLAQEVEEGARAAALAVSVLAAAISNGDRGELIRRLADARDVAQQKLASRRADLAQAIAAAQAATAKAEAARLSDQVAVLDAATAASDAVLEGMLVKLAAAWAARLAGPGATVLGLQQELLAARRRYGVTIPELKESGLTSDLLVICESVAPALEVLMAEREEATRPRVPYHEPSPAKVAAPARRSLVSHLI